MRGARRPSAETAPLRLLVPLGALLLLPACAGEESTASSLPASDSVYVEVMARLVLLDSAMTRPAEVPLRGLDRDSARQRVLDRFGVDARQLLEYAEERGRSPAATAEIWRRIQELADSLDASDWRPDGGEEDGASSPDSSPPGATS